MPLLEPSDIVSLPKGQAFALLEGGKLWKIRMLLPAGDDADEHMPEISPSWPKICAVTTTAAKGARTAARPSRKERIMAEPCRNVTPQNPQQSVPSREHGFLYNLF